MNLFFANGIILSVISKSDLVIPFTWADRKPAFLDQFVYIPKEYAHEQSRHFDWRQLFPQIYRESFQFNPFGCASGGRGIGPIKIEFCAGNGQWIVEQAKREPAVNWVAVDQRFDRSRQAWLRAKNEALTNLLVVCAEAVVVCRWYLPPDSVAGVFVNFPDPWPKRYHAKHRLVTSAFLEPLERALADTASALFVTDDAPTAARMQGEMQKRVGWASSGLYHQWPGYGVSFFEKLWKEKGRLIHYLPYAYRRIASTA
ncbi:MAG: tRNA ((7)-)-methyltransferase [Chlamydiota bacterium]|jgi:tRNA (guanine-N7-)-methyltransferase